MVAEQQNLASSASAARQSTRQLLHHILWRITRATECQPFSEGCGWCRWAEVAKQITGRSGQQCAQRWRHKVNPNIRKDKWTEEEDELLLELYQRHGNAWAEISRAMDGRTDQQCMVPPALPHFFL